MQSSRKLIKQFFIPARSPTAGPAPGNIDPSRSSFTTATPEGKSQINEFRANALRFTNVEVNKFFEKAIGFNLAVEEVVILKQSIERWPAGLQMASLAMKTQTPPHSVSKFVASFSGKNVFIIDYFADEVFNHQPEHIQAFLLHTCNLAKLSGRLCDRVTKEEGRKVVRNRGDHKNSCP